MLIKIKLSVNNYTLQILRLDLFEFHVGVVHTYGERDGAHLVMSDRNIVFIFGHVAI